MKRISPPELQKIFNDGNYWDRAKNGEFTMVVIENRHPSLMAANEPYCTESQMVSYRDANNFEVARVHQYLRPDGTIGASGRPDPKRLYKDGELYRLQKKQQKPASADPSKNINPPE